MKHAQNKPRWRRVLLAVLAAVLAAAVLIGGVYAYLYWSGRAALHGTGEDVSTPSDIADVLDDGKHVIYNGTVYQYNENVVSILFLGVDKESVKEDVGYGENGQADSLFVAAIDTVTGAVRVIPLSREIMAEVDTYGVGGGFAGIETTQLCLAYAYGKTGEQSCENVLRSVRRLLYGVDINAYAAIDLDGLAALTDAVGGVTVTVPEDISQDKYSWKQGQTVTLKGKEARFFIRHRDTDVEANNRRVARQRLFLSAFMKQAMTRVRADFTRVAAYYQTAAPYLVTDMGLPQVTYLATALVGKPASEIEYITVAGDTVMGEKYVEFHADKTSLYEAVLAAFYTPLAAESEG